DDFLELGRRSRDQLVQLLPHLQQLEPGMVEIVLLEGGWSGRELAIVLVGDQDEFRLRRPSEKAGGEHEEGAGQNAPGAGEKRLHVEELLHAGSMQRTTSSILFLSTSNARIPQRSAESESSRQAGFEAGVLLRRPARFLQTTRCGVAFTISK